ncbi:MAG TPA: hypothetical protein VH459_10635 [Gaiellales bacterium]|jgi:hypothetical protein
MSRTKISRLAAVAATGLLVAGVAAYGAWSVSGSGTGSASAATASSLTLTPGTPLTALYPNGSADVATTIANTNPFPVHVSSIALDSGQGSSGFAVDAGHSTCDLTTLSFAAQTNGGSGWDIPANDTLDVDATDAVSMSGSAGDACQGAAFTLYLTATAASS